MPTTKTTEPAETPTVIEWRAWSGRRLALAGELDQLTAELATIEEKLAEARLAAVSGAPNRETVATLLKRRRSVEAEQTEVGERLPLVMDAERRAQAAVQAEQARNQATERVERAARLREQAIESDRAIGTAAATLQDALDARWALVAERDHLRAESEMTGDRLHVAEVDFDRTRIPALSRPRRHRFGTF